MAVSMSGASCERVLESSNAGSCLTADSDLNRIYDIEKTATWITENNFQKICLQFPDQLLCDSVRVSKTLQRLTQREIYILADTSYNSCCVDEVAAQHVGSSAIVHYGHSCCSLVKSPVLFVFPKGTLDLAAFAQTLAEVASVDTSRIVVFYDVSFEHMSHELCNEVFKASPNALVGVFAKDLSENSVFSRRLLDSTGVQHDADVLQDSHLIFLGSEGPTLFNLAVSAKAEQISLLSASDCSLRAHAETGWFKRRRYLLERCRDAAAVGLLACTLAGANFTSILQQLRRLVRSRGRKCYTLTVGKPNVAKLANFPEIDVFVLVACPENDLYSSRDFMQPIVYPFELELALNQVRDPYPASYSTDFNDLLPGGRDHCQVSQTAPKADISLITGKIRHNDNNNMTDGQIASSEVGNGTSDIVKREDWTVAELNIGDALLGKSWRGLEQNLGMTAVEAAQMGRRGIASGYEQEPSH